MSESAGSPLPGGGGDLDHDDLLSWLLVSDQLSFDPLTVGGSSEGALWLGSEGTDDDGDAEGAQDDFSWEVAAPLSAPAAAAAAAAAATGPYSASMISASAAATVSSAGVAASKMGDSRKRSRPRSSKTSTGTLSSAADGEAGSGMEKKRPRDDVRYLEEKIAALQEENSALQAHVLNVTHRTTEIQRHRVAMEKEMAEKTASCGDGDEEREKELSELCKKYSDIYADYGQYRQKEVAFHLDQIEKLLVPTTVTKMSLWTLQQDQTFYQTGKSPLWDSISKALDITPEQLDRIQQGRQRIKALLAQLQESLNLVSQLRTAIAKRHAFYDDQCGGVQHIATPKQMVNFLLWITANSSRLGRLIQSEGAEGSSSSSVGLSGFAGAGGVTSPGAFPPAGLPTVKGGGEGQGEGQGEEEKLL